MAKNTTSETNSVENVSKSLEVTTGMPVAARTPPAGGDLDSLKGLRLPQGGHGPGVKVRPASVQARKPDRNWWLRVHPSWALDVALIENKETKETHIVHDTMVEALMGEWKAVRLVGAVTRQGLFFLLPVGLAGADGRVNHWHASMSDAVEAGKEAWVRIYSDMQAGEYRCVVAEADWGAPKWPDEAFDKLVLRAFKGRIIDSINHPVYLQLQGEV